MHSYSRNPSDDPSKKQGWKPLGQETIRTDLVTRIRKEIALGTYDTPEKMDLAMERLFEKALDS